MKQQNPSVFSLKSPDVIRKFLLAWILSAATVYLLSPGDLAHLQTLSHLSLSGVIVSTVIIFLLLICFRNHLPIKLERWSIVGAFLFLAVPTLIHSFSIAYLCICSLITGLLIVYALHGWDETEPTLSEQTSNSIPWKWLCAFLAVAFFLFVSIWTVCRVISFCTPTYDFGIFAQMFHNMKQSGLPVTTLERDGMLSHFKVHVSPIYYLLLPFYCLAPTPATLQVLQAAVLASAVIPLWLLGKRHCVHPALRTVIYLLLLLYPAYSGGASYDIHENAFLTPLILWLFYAIDSKKYLLCTVFTLLVLMVKEDAAVYCAIVGLYVIFRGILRPSDKKQLFAGLLILAGSLCWFFGVTGYLAKSGDGVMTYRYENFIYDGSSSLFTVIKSIILCPMKAVFECVDPEKLKFIALSLFPFLALPFFTRKYERYFLLIPYVLVNLMSDYQYQHDIFFQYTYGSTAFLFYLVVVNLADLKDRFHRISTASIATIASAIIFITTVMPKAQPYPKYCVENTEYYRSVRQTLDLIPDDASVCATTFYTTHLSQREILYDVRYASTEHLLDCEYVVLTTTNENCYKAYASDVSSGFDNLVALLQEKGYTPFAQLEGSLVIYRKN